MQIVKQIVVAYLLDPHYISISFVDFFGLYSIYVAIKINIQQGDSQ